MSIKPQVTAQISQLLDDQELLNRKQEFFTFLDDDKKHLKVSCFWAKSHKSDGKVYPEKTVLELLADHYSSELEEVICHECFWDWYDSVLTREEGFSLSSLLDSAKSLKDNQIKFAEILTLTESKQWEEVFTQVTILLLELKSRVNNFKIILSSDETNRCSYAVKENLILEESFLNYCSEIIISYTSELEAEQIRESLQYTIQSKPLPGLNYLQELLSESELLPREIEEKLQSLWLEALENNPEIRLRNVKQELLAYNPEKEISYKTIWENKLEKVLSNLLANWEIELATLLKGKPFTLLLNDALYLDSSGYFDLFEVLYPTLVISRKKAFQLPALWRDWVSISLNILNFEKDPNHSNSRLVILEDTFINQSTEMLLVLWEPGTDNLYSNPEHIQKVVGKL